jgi:hypothetical protein
VRFNGVHIVKSARTIYDIHHDSNRPIACRFAGRRRAALTSLDTLVRSEPPWAGAWRGNAPPPCASPVGAKMGVRSVTPGICALPPVIPVPPAPFWPRGGSSRRGRRFDTARLADVVVLLGLRWDDGFADFPGAIDDLVPSGRPTPFVAAAIASQIVALSPGAEVLAWWCADLVLAQKLR